MSIFLASCSNLNINKEHMEYFEGIYNGGLAHTKPYVTQGKRAHIIGLQDGSFPDIGTHNTGDIGMPNFTRRVGFDTPKD